MINRFMRVKEVMRIIGFGKTKLYELINSGRFPKPVKVGSSSVWPESEVNVWMEEEIARRDLETA